MKNNCLNSGSSQSSSCLFIGTAIQQIVLIVDAFDLNNYI